MDLTCISLRATMDMSPSHGYMAFSQEVTSTGWNKRQHEKFPSIFFSAWRCTSTRKCAPATLREPGVIYRLIKYISWISNIYRLIRFSSNINKQKPHFDHEYTYKEIFSYFENCLYCIFRIRAPLKHSLKGAVAINIEMHNVYQGGLGNTKAELSIYIGRCRGCIWVHDSTPGYPSRPFEKMALRRWGLRTANQTHKNLQCKLIFSKQLSTTRHTNIANIGREGLQLSVLR